MRYEGTLTDKEVLQLLRDAEYRVDTDLGILYGKRDVPITPWADPDGNLLVRVYFEGRRRGIALAKLVWMARTKRVVPKKFQIHHRDRNPANNRWMNLFCLYRDDHAKLHNGSDLLEETEVPF